MRVLVVGANGQLGTACCAALQRRGHQVRGSVRTQDRGADLARTGVEVVVAELTDPDGVRRLVDGVDAMVVSANGAAPRAGDRQDRLVEGFESLVRAASDAGVRRAVVPSARHTPLDAKVPLMAEKLYLLDALAAGSTRPVELLFPPFMDVWLALAGSSIPMRGEPNATMLRPSPVLKAFRKPTGRLVEDRGLMLVSGSPDARNAFIAVRDAAVACATAAERDDLEGRAQEVAGPEVLSWRQVAEILGELLHRRVRVLGTPSQVYAVAAEVLRPVSEAASATMALNRLVATVETPWTEPGGGLVDPAGMTTVKEYFAEKLAQPDTAQV